MSSTRRMARDRSDRVWRRVASPFFSLLPPPDVSFFRSYYCLLFLEVARRGGGLPTAQLEKLAGKLNHFCIVWPQGAAHMAPIYQAAHGAVQGMLPPERCASAVSALKYFYHVLMRNRQSDALCTPLPSSPDAQPGVQSFGDASGDIGFSTQMGPLLLWGTWTAAVAERVSIGNKELYPIALFSETFGDLLGGFAWLPRMDNLPNCFAILKGHTTDADLQPLLTAWLCARGRDAARPGWVPRLFNPFQDQASKARSHREVQDCMERYARG